MAVKKNITFQGLSVGFCGSRSLKGFASLLVSQVASEVLRSASSVSVGCCVGADEMFINSIISRGLVARCGVFASYGQDKQGACSLSAVGSVSLFAELGGVVRWWSGGGVRVPLRARLATRSKVLVSSASALVAFVATSSLSSGSWLSVKLAVKKGLPVVVFPMGFSGSLPSLGCGCWVPAGSGVFDLGFRWVDEARQELIFTGKKLKNIKKGGD